MSDIHEEMRIGLTITPPTSTQRWRAAVAVCGRFTDDPATQQILDMLGLLDIPRSGV